MDVWKRSFLTLSRNESFELALLGGAQADRTGYAFAAGYQAALLSLLGKLDGICALSATEADGAHPRAIKTSLEAKGEAFQLEGEKIWATLAPIAEVFIVIATRGEREGRPQLVAVRMPRKHATIEPGPQTPFVPEIPHGIIRFSTQVRAEDVLPGDGYLDYLKPFRTIEDIHVHAALGAHLFRLGRAQGWPHELLEALLVQLAALKALSTAPPLEAATHLALAGSINALRALMPKVQAELEARGGALHERFERDLGILQVAQKARGKRREKAWALAALQTD